MGKKVISKFKKAATIYVVLSLLASLSPASAAVEEKRYKIQAVDMEKVRLDDGRWVKLIGVDMTGLSNSLKPPLLFMEEVNAYLRSFIGREVQLELDDTFKTLGHKELGNTLAYVYYMEPSADIPVIKPPGDLSKPFMVLEDVRTNDGKVQGKMVAYTRRLLNQDIILSGYARAVGGRPYKFSKEFELTQNRAKENKSGIWL